MYPSRIFQHIYFLLANVERLDDLGYFVHFGQFRLFGDILVQMAQTPQNDPECQKQPRRAEHVTKRRFSLRPIHDPDRATVCWRFISCARVGGAHSASSPQAGSSGDEGPYNNIVIFTVFPGYCRIMISIGILTNFPNSIACHIGITDGAKL